MIRKYLFYSIVVLLDLALVFAVAPTLIDFHDTITIFIGFAIWWLQPVALVLLIRKAISDLNSSTKDEDVNEEH